MIAGNTQDNIMLQHYKGNYLKTKLLLTIYRLGLEHPEKDLEAFYSEQLMYALEAKGW